MTMFTQKEVIQNLRREKKKLEDTLEAVKGWLEIVFTDNESHASPEDLRQLKDLLEAEK